MLPNGGQRVAVLDSKPSPLSIYHPDDPDSVSDNQLDSLPISQTQTGGRSKHRVSVRTERGCSAKPNNLRFRWILECTASVVSFSSSNEPDTDLPCPYNGLLNVSLHAEANTRYKPVTLPKRH